MPIHFKKSLLVLIFLLLIKAGYCQDWTRMVRTSGHGLQNIESVKKIMSDARETFLYGIEVDNDIPGRYESFLNPKEKLDAIKIMADSAHACNNKSFVYIAGLECISTGAENPESSTFFRDHPDWVQRNRKGEPAIFGGGAAFWIGKGEEDVWISPYAPEWRKLYMQRIREIAATGIDGIYVDIPYWMTHFDGWEDTWASFDKYTTEAFRNETGLDAMKDFVPGNWEDPGFIKWINFRIKTINDFIEEITRNAKSVNKDCKIIIEVYPGLDEDVPRVGADNYHIYQIADVIAHEYTIGDHSASRSPFQWLQYMIAMHTFRTFAGSKATWMLDYSWDGERNIQPSDAMKNLFSSQVMAGANSWDARRMVMSGSNDYDARKEIFKWISEHEKLIYSDRNNISPVGVYFSPETRNYFSAEWRDAFMGALEILILNHIEFEIVTPLTLAGAKCNLLILPDIRSISENELTGIKNFLSGGGNILYTGKTGHYDENRTPVVDTNLFRKYIGQFPGATAIPGNPAAEFNHYLKENYNSSVYEDAGINFTNDTYDTFLNKIREHYVPFATVENADGCVTQITSVDNKPALFISNFTGISSNENAIPIPRRNMIVTFNRVPQNVSGITFLPFLGNPIVVEGKREGDKLIVNLPSFLRGAIVTVE